MTEKGTKFRIGHVVVELTSRCNQRCLYCYNVWKRNRRHIPEQTTLQEGYRIARGTLATLFRQAKPDRITMSGGEPLLAERFLELVLFCRMRGAGVTVISNGTGAPGREYRELVALGVDLFEFSINSDKSAVHDHLAGVAGSWQKATQLAREMSELTRVVAVVVLTRLNAARIGETLRFIRSLGIRRVMVNRFNIGGSGVANADALLLSRDELQSSMRTAAIVAKEEGLRISANVCTPWCIIDPGEFPGIRMGSCGTDARAMPLTVTANGDLRLCNHSPVVLGNIHEDAVERLLSAPYADRFFGTVPEYCAECVDYERCRGGCRAVSEQLGIPLQLHDPVCTTIRQ